MTARGLAESVPYLARVVSYPVLVQCAFWLDVNVPTVAGVILAQGFHAAYLVDSYFFLSHRIRAKAEPSALLSRAAAVLYLCFVAFVVFSLAMWSCVLGIVLGVLPAAGF